MSLDDLPLTLRYERFGGSVFDPRDGTLVELDAEAFDVLRKGLVFKSPLNSEEREFMKELGEQIQLNDDRQAKVYRHDLKSQGRQVEYLSAPTLVDFQITNQCYLGCPHCYASSVPEDGHCSWEEMELVLDNLEACGVHQIAIGGGEPLLHPDLTKFIRECGRRGIVPNITTNGMHFTDDLLEAISEACGAVGMSLEAVGEDYQTWRSTGFAQLQKNIARLKEHRIQVALQVTLSKSNFVHLPNIVKYLKDQDGLYGVVFLAYKPVGRGADYDEPLSALNQSEVSSCLRDAFIELSPKMRVGFDCCMTPAVAGIGAEMEYVDHDLLEGCSAMRGSLGIDVNLNVVPCTFVTQFPMGNLKNKSLLDIWNDHRATSFRMHMTDRVEGNAQCSSCVQNQNCVGGCPVMPLVNCHNDYQQDGIRSYPGNEK